MEDMRSPEFPKFTLPLFEDVKKVFKLTNGRVFMFPSSGTGAWESAISNTLNRGDKVLMSRFGQFSLLWVDMAQRLGLNVEVLDEEWGKGVPVEKYADILAADKSHEIKAVFATHNETATGVTSDVAGVRKALDAAKHPALLFVDGVSSRRLASTSAWKSGASTAASRARRRASCCRPASASSPSASKALDANKILTKMERCYFSFEDMIKNNDLGYFPYTPATQLLRGLRASLDLLLAEGLDNVFARHHRLAEGVRKAVDGVGPQALRARSRNGTPTRSAPSSCPRASTARGREDGLLSLQHCRSASASTRSPARCSASATSARSTRSWSAACCSRSKWRC